MDKQTYFQREIDYFKDVGHVLIEQKKDSATLQDPSSSTPYQLEIHHSLIDACYNQFTFPCFAIKRTTNKRDIWYLYLMVDGRYLVLDLKVIQEKEKCTFFLDFSEWDETNMDLNDFDYLPDDIQEHVLALLAWFESWMKENSSYRLWFVTHGSTFTYSHSVEVIQP